MGQGDQFRPLGETAQKAARHRRFHWCRRESGFSDKPLWRVVAAELSLPLVEVLAFVNRLEELANAAEQRGSVADFNAAEFAAALAIPKENAARIFAALERPEIGWVAYDHVADFHPRNPDKQDDTVLERKQRSRARKSAMQSIAKMYATGSIDELERAALERQVLERNWDGRIVHRSQRSQVTNVTVTPEQSKDSRLAAVENFGDAGAAISAGPAGAGAVTHGSPNDAATQWLATEARRMVAQYLQLAPAIAEMYVERWRRDLDDDVALRTIIEAADGMGYIGARFHTLITDGVRRQVIQRQQGGQASLPLKTIVRSGNG